MPMRFVLLAAPLFAEEVTCKDKLLEEIKSADESAPKARLVVDALDKDVQELGDTSLMRKEWEKPECPMLQELDDKMKEFKKITKKMFSSNIENMILKQTKGFTNYQQEVAPYINMVMFRLMSTIDKDEGAMILLWRMIKRRIWIKYTAFKPALLFALVSFNDLVKKEDDKIFKINKLMSIAKEIVEFVEFRTNSEAEALSKKQMKKLKADQIANQLKKNVKTWEKFQDFLNSDVNGQNVPDQLKKMKYNLYNHKMYNVSTGPKSKYNFIDGAIKRTVKTINKLNKEVEKWEKRAQKEAEKVLAAKEKLKRLAAINKERNLCECV